MATDHVESAIVSIRRLVRVLRLAAQRTQLVSGLSAAQSFVLEQLGEAGRLSMNELASRTMTDRSSVADVVDRLNEQGLVDRDVDPADRRRASVRITPSGRRRLARAPEAPGTALIAALRKLKPRDRATLARSLVLLNLALGASDEPASFLFADERGKTPPRRRARR
jgi:MarR family transcriptional regulator, lower aerobic nicotinate degradation pathway regulator